MEASRRIGHALVAQGVTRTWSTRSCSTSPIATSALGRDDIVTQCRLHLRRGDARRPRSGSARSCAGVANISPAAPTPAASFATPRVTSPGVSSKRPGARDCAIGHRGRQRKARELHHRRRRRVAPTTSTNCSRTVRARVLDRLGRGARERAPLPRLRGARMSRATRDVGSVVERAPRRDRVATRTSTRRAGRRATRDRVDRIEAARRRHRLLKVSLVAAVGRWRRSWSAGEWVLRQSYFRVQHVTVRRRPSRAARARESRRRASRAIPR